MNQHTADSAVAEELRRLEQKRVDALVGADVSSLETLYADDLIYTHSTGLVETKAEFIGRLANGERRYKSMEHEQGLVLRVYGDAAVLNGSTRVKVEARGEFPILHLRFTEVWVRRGDRWQVVAWHATRLPE